jgi:hypothetical protein
MLGRFRARFKEQDWFGVGVELLIVAIGVFLGMQVSNWNDARVAHERGQTYRAQIIADIGANARELSVLFNYYAEVRRHAIAALAALDAPAGAGDAQFVIDAFQATQILPRSLTHAAFDEASNTGAFENVGVAAERRAISDYYLSVASIAGSVGHETSYRELVRSRVPPIVQEKVQEACGDRSDTASFVTILPATCVPDVSAAEATAAAWSIRTAPGVRDALVRQISELDQDLRLLPVLSAYARVLTQRLSRASG